MLKSLELTGFKSFAKKTVFPFENRVTAIVGPNGSGKSNIVEAIRYVLGEQSIKSLRGKSGADLIFQGSKELSKQNRASVTIVFDNKNKIFKLPEGNRPASTSLSLGGPEINLDFDEISISREVFRDGRSEYSINGTEVRLKDILEIVSSVNIGSSGHQIISQGETDRLLNASPRERKQIIEDALGLKVYQYRLLESERKIEKTEENIKEIGIIKREIAPQLNFLKKQAEKIEKALILKEQLISLYKEYLKTEEKYIKTEKSIIASEKTRFLKRQNEIEKLLVDLGSDRSQTDEKLNSEINAAESKAREINSFKEELARKLGRIEGILEIEEEKGISLGREQEKKQEISISFKEINVLLENIAKDLKIALLKENLIEIHSLIENIQKTIEIFIGSKNSFNEDKKEEVNIKIGKLKESQNKIQEEINNLIQEEKNFQVKAIGLKKSLEENKNKERENDIKRYELNIENNNLFSELKHIAFREENIVKIENDFLEELKEGQILIDDEILTYKDFNITNTNESRIEQEDKRKKIERIKIKLEDIGVGSGADIMKEYQDLKERDEFLSRELLDLGKSIESLEDLIKELKEKLENEFQGGIKKINEQFEEFFKLMFGGGTASLSLLEIEKKKRRIDKNEEDEYESAYAEGHSTLRVSDSMSYGETKEEIESGILINVSLPKKKVKELHALSGGERSLTSIALLFAMSQVNPPPFLVLDETDAALDESNSRKYGDMVEKLSKFSQLILVTHNRETMSRASALYGVTIGSDGASRTLSVKFEEAVVIAK